MVWTGNAANVAAVFVNVREIASGINIWHNLTHIFQRTSSGFNHILYDFVMLYWAKNDIDYGDEQRYWHYEKMNNDNAEEVVIRYAKNWLEKHKPLIDNLLPLP